MTHDYELLRKIAEGGMGEVFVARKRGPGSFDKLVAVKLMLPHLAEDAERRDRFMAEARVAAMMQHPNVVEIFDVGERDGRPFLAMQWVDGVTLATLVHAVPKGTFPLPLARFIGLSLCEGLAHVHELTDRQGRPMQLVHRDVSPSNVLVSQNGAVLLTDFGIARARDSEWSTRPGVVRGKPAWVSPEQLQGIKADHRADQYSAALVLYELISGEQPFRAVQGSKERGSVRSLSVVRWDVPSQLSAALHRALSVRPEDRFPSMREFGKALLDGDIATAPDLGDFIRAHCRDRLDAVQSIAAEVSNTGTIDPSPMTPASDPGDLHGAPTAPDRPTAAVVFAREASAGRAPRLPADQRPTMPLRGTPLPVRDDVLPTVMANPHDLPGVAEVLRPKPRSPELSLSLKLLIGAAVFSVLVPATLLLIRFLSR